MSCRAFAVAALLALSLTPAFAGSAVGAAAQAQTLKPVFNQYANLVTSAPQWLRGREVSCTRSLCICLGAHPVYWLEFLCHWILLKDSVPALDTGPVLYSSTAVYVGTASIVSAAGF